MTSISLLYSRSINKHKHIRLTHNQVSQVYTLHQKKVKIFSWKMACKVKINWKGNNDSIRFFFVVTNKTPGHLLKNCSKLQHMFARDKLLSKEFQLYPLSKRTNNHWTRKAATTLIKNVIDYGFYSAKVCFFQHNLTHNVSQNIVGYWTAFVKFIMQFLKFKTKDGNDRRWFEFDVKVKPWILSLIH